MLQFAKVVTAQAQIVGKIPRAFKMTQMDVIQFASKMLLRLRHIESNGLEARNCLLNFVEAAAAHRTRKKPTRALGCRDGGDVTMS
jgi:hypothetical protein